MPSFSQTLTLKEAFETDAQLDEEEFDGAFYKIFKLLLDSFFFHFFAKRRKSVAQVN